MYFNHVSKKIYLIYYTFLYKLFSYHPSFKKKIAFINIVLYSCLLSKIYLLTIYQTKLYNKIDQLILKPISLHQIVHISILINYPLLNLNISKYYFILKNGFILRIKSFNKLSNQNNQKNI